MELDRLLPPLAGEDHRCESCDYSYPETTIEAAADLIAAMPQRYADEIAATTLADLRTRPDEQTWSVLEYLCHVRDVYSSGMIRLFRIRSEERPAFEPMLADLRAVRFRYNELDPHPVLRELELHVGGFLDEVAHVDDWDRVATRLPTEERTAAWLVRHLAHEGLHHRHDIARVRSAVTVRS